MRITTESVCSATDHHSKFNVSVDDESVVVICSKRSGVMIGFGPVTVWMSRSKGERVLELLTERLQSKGETI